MPPHTDTLLACLSPNMDKSFQGLQARNPQLVLTVSMYLLSKAYLEAYPDADEEDFYNLWATASTFIILFILSIFYSATVTLIKVKRARV